MSFHWLVVDRLTQYRRAEQVLYQKHESLRDKAKTYTCISVSDSDKCINIPTHITPTLFPAPYQNTSSHPQTNARTRMNERQKETTDKCTNYVNILVVSAELHEGHKQYSSLHQL